MALSLSTADAALKEFYLGPIREQLNQDAKFLMLLERNSKDVEGRRAVLSLHTRRNSGAGARAELGTLPSAGNQGYREERVPLRYNYGRIQLSGPVIRAMRSDEGSFTRAMDSEVRGMVNDLKRDVNRQVFGTSDGVIVQVGAGSTTTVVNFATTATAVQKRQIEVGMLVDIGTASPFTSVGTAREVTAITGTTSFTVSPAFAVAPASGDSVVRSGSGGSGSAQKELTGLQTIVDSTGTLFNVDPLVEPVWASFEDTSGTPRSVSETFLARLMHNVNISGGEDLDLFITSDGVHRAYAAQLTAEKRFVGTLDLKGGYKAISVTAGGGEIGIVWDRDAPNNVVFGLNTKHLFIHESSDWEWMDDDGAVLSRVAGLDAYEAVLFRYMELTTDKRNAFAKADNIIEA